MASTIGHPRALALVRHGESAGNVANDLARANRLEELDLAERDMDVPLSDRGHQQARTLGRWFERHEEPDVVFASPYRRALDTARIGLQAAGLDIPIVADERLREREFGMLDRLTRAGIESRYPEQAAARAFLGKMYHRPPGGESWVDVIGRARSFYTDLRLDHAGQRIVVVAHQAVILCFRYVLEGLTEGEVLALDKAEDVPNTAITVYEGDGRGRPELRCANEVGHLPDELRTDRPDVPAAPR